MIISGKLVLYTVYLVESKQSISKNSDFTIGNQNIQQDGRPPYAYFEPSKNAKGKFQKDDSVFLKKTSSFFSK